MRKRQTVSKLTVLASLSSVAVVCTGTVRLGIPRLHPSLPRTILPRPPSSVFLPERWLWEISIQASGKSATVESVPRDTVTAFTWYLLAEELDRKSGWDKEFSQMAAKFNNDLIDKLSSIQKKIKPEESSACQVRKNEWVRSHSSSFVAD
jgi:hypothetical protein